MRIILLVGPSGVGKDTLLRGAREHFCSLTTGQDSRSIGFVRRYITRPPDTNEDNYYVDREGFLLLEQSDFFLSTWQAHNNHYGIASHSVHRPNGHSALLISISRSKIADFENSFPRTTTIQVTAHEEVLRDRLAGRARETEEQIKKRLLRARQQPVARDLVVFHNDQPLEESRKAFNSLLVDLC